MPKMMKLLTPAEVARRAGVTPAAVRWWANEGKLRADKSETGRRFFLEPKVTDFLNKRAEKILAEGKDGTGG